MASKNGNGKKTPPSAAVNLIAGGGAGMMEALVCHPLGKLPPRNAPKPGANLEIKPVFN
jgi:solute carrier family 25 citrate transporter 1